MNKTTHKVVEIEELTPETFVLRVERNNFEFIPGQYVILRMPDEHIAREYSIYSGITDQYLEFLIREIPAGEFSRYLRHLTPETTLEVEGPNGFFVPDERTMKGTPSFFIATGTGISPFHSIIRSHHSINYQILHGVKFADEAYGRQSFNPQQYTLCTSRGEQGDYFGRVSSYLREHPVQPDVICYLCGNSEMINEVTDILEGFGLPPENIRTEVFF
jgi:ferredoxin-NADP reductase